MIMTLHEEQERVQKAVNHSLSHVQEDPWLAQRVLAHAKGEEPMVKKVSLAFIILLVLSVITITALAAGILYNQDWYYNNRGSALRDHQPEIYEAVMANLTENPEQTQSENSLVDVSVQDVSWTPEAEKLTISFKVSPKNPAQYANINARLPIGRWGTSDDLKGAVVFLSSDASDYISGTALVIDGGYTVK